ncbi:MAG TPA: tRNA pseudouridine(55) synthase TruB, partial [Polyangia bacterium]|nr:tRNA pseudouridine(55) synthase TruB [Polyangia bacterium]
VLPVCLGEATKLAAFLLDGDKAYQATVCFGVETDTYDADGAETRRADAGDVTEACVQEALASFRGPIRQRPPAFSALKRNGRPLYEYARRGEAVEAPERTVVIHELALVRFEGPGSVTLNVRCSKGTYIRSLAFDLGRVLGPGAHLRALRRTRSGPFDLAAARPLAALTEMLRRGDGALPLIGLADALGYLPRLHADPASALAVRQGRKVPWSALQAGAGAAVHPDPPGRCLILGPAGTLLAVAEPGADGLVRSLRVFNGDGEADLPRPASVTG